MKQMVIDLLDFLSVEATVLFTAMLPVIELRGAIPIGVSLGLSPLHSAALSYIGSLLPVPFILFAIRPVFSVLRRNKSLRKVVDKIIFNSNIKHKKKIKKYGIFGLVLLVAVPLPGTGVWSGSLAAALMNMRFRRAFPAIIFGNFIAALAIMSLSKGVTEVLS